MRSTNGRRLVEACARGSSPTLTLVRATLRASAATGSGLASYRQLCLEHLQSLPSAVSEPLRVYNTVQTVAATLALQ